MNKLLFPLLVLVFTGCETRHRKGVPDPIPPQSGPTAMTTPPSSRPGDPRSQALLNHPKWSPQVQAWVREGRLGINMPSEAVQAAWGTAAQKKSSITGGSTKEEWIYSYPKDPHVYHLFFENGELKTWTQTN